MLAPRAERERTAPEFNDGPQVPNTTARTEDFGKTAGVATIFDSVFGAVELERRPRSRNNVHLAWDAADAVLLEELQALDPPGPVLVVNDRSGALALPLAKAGLSPTVFGDSRLAELAIADNAGRSGIAAPIPCITPGDLATTPFPVAVWRVPKSLALLEDQVASLHDWLAPDAVVFVGGMDRHMPPRVTEIVGALGDVDLIPRRRKARVFRLTHRADRPAPARPPIDEVGLPGWSGPDALVLRGGPALFSSGRLDRGSAFLVDQMHRLPASDRIADLGCGTGILGIVAARLQPDAEFWFVDESYAAIAAARDNWERNIRSSDITDTAAAHFKVDDCFSGFDGPPLDLVLCNPPFHQDHVVADELAWRMFTHSWRHLREGGQLWIVGNRHLGYHSKLKKIFGNVRQLAGNDTFVALSAVR